MGKIIGIDLGSTASAVAVMENGSPVIIVNSEGNRTTPSVVAYTRDGDVKVGDSAKRQSITNPKSTVELVKRFIGNSYSKAKQFSDVFPYEIAEGPNDTVVIKIDGKTLTPQEISAAILQKLKKAAEDYLGEPVTDAVITVPAYFDDSQRTATMEAGAIAGLNVKRIINEPTAASLAFGVDKSDKSMKVMVVDFGGSTTDVSVLDIGDGVFEVLSTKGNMILGGRDIDNAIVKWLFDECKKDYGVDVSSDSMAYQRVQEAAEKAKIELSNTTSTDVNLPYLTVHDGNPVHFVKTLTRSQFEKLASPFVDKCMSLAEDALKAAGLSSSDIDEILFVGGSTRIPLLQTSVKTRFGKEGNRSVNPDEAVALGAAVQGGVLSGEKTGILLLDVTPLNLNIATMGDVATCMIEANTTIPVEKTNVFTTAQDNQSEVTISINQGGRSIASANKQLGNFNLDGIAPARRGVPQIEVKFSIDANGVLSVSAKDKGTGKEQHITIEGSGNLEKSELERMKAEAESNAENDRLFKERVDKLNSAETLIYSTEKTMDELKDKLTEDEKNTLNESLNALKSVYNVSDSDRDMDAIEAACKKLTEAFYPITSRIYSEGESSTAETGTEAESDFNIG